MQSTKSVPFAFESVNLNCDIRGFMCNPRLLIVTLLLACTTNAYCLPDALRGQLPGASQVGSATMTFLFKDVYEISLYSPGAIFDSSRPFALKLDYKIPIKSDAIVERTISLIRKQAPIDQNTLAQWEKALLAIVPDVDKGINLTGFKDQNGSTQFYRNETWVGQITDKEFTARFFAIWLSEQHTPEPKLRRQLLGIH